MHIIIGWCLVQHIIIIIIVLEICCNKKPCWYALHMKWDVELMKKESWCILNWYTTLLDAACNKCSHMFMSSPLWCCTLSCSMVHSTTSRSRPCTCFLGGTSWKINCINGTKIQPPQKDHRKPMALHMLITIKIHWNLLQKMNTKRHNLNYTLPHGFICLFFCSPVHQCAYI